MPNKIEQDHARFKRIVQGKVREELKRHLSQGEMVGRKGKQLVSIPIPQIDIPHFRFGKNPEGIGQGEGNPGDPVGEGEGEAQAGDQPGQHMLEVDVTLDELSKFMAEELELPRIEPKGKKSVKTQRDRYTGMKPVGPEALRRFKRTYREALKRQISAGSYDPTNPIVVPIKKDTRYLSWNEVTQPQTNAVIILMMDISGSMEAEQKEIVRVEAFWLDTWLRSQYNGIETRYIVHDTEAHLVNEETFFHIKESGGTMISSAYKRCVQLIEEEFPPDEWNIYPFHFSDGDNWSQRDTDECLALLKDKILPRVNLFCYGQVESPYGTGKFIKELRKAFEGDERMALSEIKDKSAIVDSIKTFLGRGK